MKIIGVTCTVLMALILAGCAASPSFRPAGEQDVFTVENHIQIRKLGGENFEFQSFGRTGGTPPDHDIAWQRLAAFSTENWHIELLAPEADAAQIALALSETMARPGTADTMRTEDMLKRVLVDSDRLVADLLGAPRYKTRIRLHSFIAGKSYSTPRTAWQIGPALSGERELNLALALPVGRTPENAGKIVNVALISLAIRFVVHEYVHVHAYNGARPKMPPLADEYFAHMLDRCAAINTFFRFQSSSTNDQLIAAGEELLHSPDSMRARPFATSSTGQDLALATIGAYLVGIPSKAPEHAEWQLRLPALCKRVANGNPNFNTVDEALEWIRAVLRTP